MAHNCHSKYKSLTANTNHSQQIQITHSKYKSLTANTSHSQQIQITHSKYKSFTANTNCSQQHMIIDYTDNGKRSCTVKKYQFLFLFSFLSINSFATSTSHKLPLRVLWVLSKATWLKRFCNIFALRQDFIHLAAENGRSPEQLLRGWHESEHRSVSPSTSLIIHVLAKPIFLIAFKVFEKHSTFFSSIKIMKISWCGMKYSILTSPE